MGALSDRMNTWITVKNVTGTADRSCSCGTWLQHW
jgi:hypothetical protein